jgi:hypothetical protein
MRITELIPYYYYVKTTNKKASSTQFWHKKNGKNSLLQIYTHTLTHTYRIIKKRIRQYIFSACIFSIYKNQDIS